MLPVVVMEGPLLDKTKSRDMYMDSSFTADSILINVSQRALWFCRFTLFITECNSNVLLSIWPHRLTSFGHPLGMEMCENDQSAFLGTDTHIHTDTHKSCNFTCICLKSVNDKKMACKCADMKRLPCSLARDAPIQLFLFSILIPLLCPFPILIRRHWWMNKL